jgi:integrase
MARLINQVISYNTEYSDSIREELRSKLNQLGDNISFTDDTWFCNKLKKSAGHTNNKYRIYFSRIPEQYRDIVKYYVLKENVQITTLSTRIGYLVKFFQYLEDECNSIPLRLVSRQTIEGYKTYLLLQDGEKSWKQNVWSALYRFFKAMHDWTELPNSMPITYHNPWTRNFRDRRIDAKYIPKFVTDQLDKIFLNEVHPVHHRLAYWIMRTIPSRVSEVTGMKINCIKPYGDNYVISIPTWKQNGGHIEPQIRCIHIEDSGMGNFLINLIKNQQDIANIYQDSVLEKDMLFTIENLAFCGRHFDKTGEIKYSKKSDKPYILNPTGVARILNMYCKRYKVVDEKMKPYSITSHQLRHNGITDRLHEGFSLIEIRDMTGHQGNAMIYNSYHHIQPELNKEAQNRLIKAKYESVESAPVYFRGRILNMDNKLEQRLLANPRAFRISDGKFSIGICSDVTTCQSGMFECLNCTHFVPNADNLEYYQDQVLEWQKKVDLFKNQKFALEKAEYILALYKSLIKKIKSALIEKDIAL